MVESDAPVCENLPHKQTAMTVPRLALAANEGDAVLGSTVNETVDHLLEARLLRHLAVQGVALGVVMLGPRRPAPSSSPANRYRTPAASMECAKASRLN